MKRKIRHSANEVALIAGCVILLIVLLDLAFSVQMREAYEVVTTLIVPNASADMTYGEEHFDSSAPDEYNIGLAEYFFSQAAKLDPNVPYLYHELARIAFLKGNFSLALVEINQQIELHGDSEPNAYYVRGLIEGYMGHYRAAAADYEQFIQFDPHNWAAENDEAWVLLKAKDYSQALQVANAGLADASGNAWLLNSKSIALYELRQYQQALAAAQSASIAVLNLTPQEWSLAYPGNDPAIAAQGLAAFKAAVAANLQMIQQAIAART